MTQEEKAKRYDKAIGRAKEQLNGAKVFDYDNEQIAHDIRTTVYNIFPEIKEPEDERIRKEIFNVIKSLPLSHERTGMLCWLEKQAEKRSVSPKFRVGDTIQSCFNKQAIDKVIRIDDDIYILSSGGYVRIEFQDNWKLVEQKPGWSEEEKTYHSYILTNCMHYADAMGYVDEKKNNQLHKKAEDWFKSLKDRVGNFDDGYKVGFSAAKHNQWKPSEKQMEALDYVIENEKDIPLATYSALCTLYNDLKKIKAI